MKQHKNMVYDDKRMEVDHQEHCYSFFLKAEQQMQKHLGKKKKYEVERNGWMMKVSELDSIAELDLRLTCQWKYNKDLGGITFLYNDEELILWFDRMDFVSDDNIHFLGLHDWRKRGDVV